MSQINLRYRFLAREINLQFVHHVLNVSNTSEDGPAGATDDSGNSPTRRHQVETTLAEQSILSTFHTPFSIRGECKLGAKLNVRERSRMLEPREGRPQSRQQAIAHWACALP
jgi:hypothetical protein